MSWARPIVTLGLGLGAGLLAATAGLAQSTQPTRIGGGVLVPPGTSLPTPPPVVPSTPVVTLPPAPADSLIKPPSLPSAVTAPDLLAAPSEQSGTESGEDQDGQGQGRTRPRRTQPGEARTSDPQLRLPLEIAQPTQILIATADARQGARIAANSGATPLAAGTLAALGVNLTVINVPHPSMVAATLKRLEVDPQVLLAQRNYTYVTATAPEATTTASTIATGQRSQYALDRIRAPEVWTRTTGRGVLIGVIDTRIDDRQPALAGRLAGRVDLARSAGDPGWHGTWLAGILVAQGGLRGVAPDARLLAIQAFVPNPQNPVDGISTSERVARGIDAALSGGVRILNLSLAGPEDPLVARLIRAALSRNVVVVAAAGNGGPKAAPAYPAALPGVIAVAALDRRDRIWNGSAAGPHVAVAAPGVEIVTTGPGATIQYPSGTSMAAAHVSGAVALLLEREPTLTPAQVRARLVPDGAALPVALDVRRLLDGPDGLSADRR